MLISIWWLYWQYWFFNSFFCVYELKRISKIKLFVKENPEGMCELIFLSKTDLTGRINVISRWCCLMIIGGFFCSNLFSWSSTNQWEKKRLDKNGAMRLKGKVNEMMQMGRRVIHLLFTSLNGWGISFDFNHVHSLYYQKGE